METSVLIPNETFSHLNDASEKDLIVTGPLDLEIIMFESVNGRMHSHSDGRRRLPSRS